MRFGLQIPNFTRRRHATRPLRRGGRAGHRGRGGGLRLGVGDGPLLPTARRWAGRPSPCWMPTRCSARWRPAPTTVRLGTMVTGVTYRNPAHLAKIVTTLDVISAGRAILGIGAAWYDVEHEGLGFDFPPAGERLDRLEEALQICRAMFTEEAPSFDGPLLPDPRGPQRAAARAARRAAHPDRRRRGEADARSGGALRRHVQHLRRRRHGRPQGRRAAPPLRGHRPGPRPR